MIKYDEPQIVLLKGSLRINEVFVVDTFGQYGEKTDKFV